MVNDNELLGQVFSADKAREVASELQDGELDGWSYVLEIAGNFGCVRVIDNEGVFVGYF